MYGDSGDGDSVHVGWAGIGSLPEFLDLLESPFGFYPARALILVAWIGLDWWFGFGFEAQLLKPTGEGA